MLRLEPVLIAGLPEQAEAYYGQDACCCESESGVTDSADESVDLGYYHETVLLEEAVHFMAPAEGKVLVDGTLGGGGHTEKMLEAGATVIGIDQDPEALAYAGKRLAKFGDRFIPVKGNFTDALALLQERGIGKVDGFLVDLGVSSRQFDEAARGFSFSKEGPLDMRMSDEGETAADLINGWDESELVKIFWEFGEERSSRRIAKRICEAREIEAFVTTTQLAECIEKCVPRHGKKIHPATKVFQALRIQVNNELGSLRGLLDTSADLLSSGGRLCVISFHSLEDRMVKRFLKKVSALEIDKREWPEPRPNPDLAFKNMTRKPVKAGEDEVKRNARSRSAVMRIGERI